MVGRTGSLSRGQSSRAYLALSENGSAQLIGLTLSDGRTTQALDEWSQTARQTDLVITVCLLSHTDVFTSGRFRDLLVRTISIVSESREEDVSLAYTSMLAKQSVTHLCRYFLHARRGHGRLRIIDTPSMSDSTGWHV